MANQPGAPLNAAPQTPPTRRISKIRVYGILAAAVIAVLFALYLAGQKNKRKEEDKTSSAAPADQSLNPTFSQPRDYSQLPPPAIINAPPPPEERPAQPDNGRGRQHAEAGGPNLLNQVIPSEGGNRNNDRDKASGSAILIDDRGGAGDAVGVGANRSATSKALADLDAAQTSLQQKIAAGPDLSGLERSLARASGAGPDQGGVAEHLQDQKSRFAANGAENGGTADLYAKGTLVPPRSPFVIQHGWYIPAAMATAINSDIPGDVSARVTESVYDTPTGRYLLIPQQSVLYGRLNTVIAPGQSRVQIVWTVLRRPDGSEIQLPAMNAVDEQGRTGVDGAVDNHLDNLATGIGLSAVVSFLGALAQNTSTTTAGTTINLGQTAGQSAAQTASQVGSQYVSRQLQIQPTITKEIGEPIIAEVNQDLILSPYKAR